MDRPVFSPEIGQAVGSLMANGDTMLMGRVTYQTFAASFAGNTSDPMAAQMNAIPKVVVSATLDQADWENSTLIRHDVPQAITRLKEQPGQNINISGSATLVAWLLTRACSTSSTSCCSPSWSATASGCSAMRAPRPH